MTPAALGSSTEDVRALVTAAYGELAGRAGTAACAVAVRSSAVDEDGATSSFAGQHETYLNIVGADAVCAAVLRCAESARSARALAYRQAQGLAGAAPIAVLVQLLVPADAAAVVFTADPVGDGDDVSIDANWGLGESIVSGSVTPDSYVVRRADLRVIRRTIGAKERMTVLATEGIREIPVPSTMRGRHVLDDASAVQAARLALALESELGHPVDVECAFRGGLLFLLQCRPITTLGHAPGR